MERPTRQVGARSSSCEMLKATSTVVCSVESKGQRGEVGSTVDGLLFSRSSFTQNHKNLPLLTAKGTRFTSSVRTPANTDLAWFRLTVDAMTGIKKRRSIQNSLKALNRRHLLHRGDSKADVADVTNLEELQL